MRVGWQRFQYARAHPNKKRSIPSTTVQALGATLVGGNQIFYSTTDSNDTLTSTNMLTSTTCGSSISIRFSHGTDETQTKMTKWPPMSSQKNSGISPRDFCMEASVLARCASDSGGIWVLATTSCAWKHGPFHAENNRLVWRKIMTSKAPFKKRSQDFCQRCQGANLHRPHHIHIISVLRLPQKQRPSIHPSIHPPLRRKRSKTVLWRSVEIVECLGCLQSRWYLAWLLIGYPIHTLHVWSFYLPTFKYHKSKPNVSI